MRTPEPAPRARETILVLDPLDPTGRAARDALRAEGRAVLTCVTAQEALQLLRDSAFDCMVAALDPVDLDGKRLLEAVRTRAPGTPVIAVAASATVEGAVQAMRAGAVDYLGRPISRGLLTEKVARAVRDAQTSRNLAQAQQHARDDFGFTRLLSMSPRMMQVFDAIRAVAPTDATVLILGETGTGKELVAQAIHERSRRKDRTFIGVNCGAFTDTLLESELFGHEKGSFTGAVGQRKGVFEMADGGSLFLDELGETSLAVQVSLLRVLEEHRFRRVGGRELVDIDVRIIAATNVNLESAVKAARFREDLFYRLNVFPVTLPPLRERREDIPILMKLFLQDAAEDYEMDLPAIQPEVLEHLQNYRWPGNVRQLRALCERWVIQCAGRELREDMLPADVRGAVPTPPSGGAMVVDETVALPVLIERVGSQVERAYLHRMLEKHRGRLQDTAAAAGITRRTLYTRMRALGLEQKDYK